MKELKVGQQFEVVEVLYSTFTDKTLFKIGGFTVGKSHSERLIKCMGNGSKSTDSDMGKVFMSTCYLSMYKNSEVKPIGKLTITKLK